MQTITTFFKLFTAFLLTMLFGTSAYAVDIQLDGNITKVYPHDNINTSCKQGDIYRLSNDSNYSGVPFDLLLEVTSEDNEGDELLKFHDHDLSEENATIRPCISIQDYSEQGKGKVLEVLLRAKNETNSSGSNMAYVNFKIIPIKKVKNLTILNGEIDNSIKLSLDKLAFTAFDLDRFFIDPVKYGPKQSNTDTDDVYIPAPGQAKIALHDSEVEIIPSVFIDDREYTKLKGTLENCLDYRYVRRCSGSGILRGNLEFRLQNDNAGGNVRRYTRYSHGVIRYHEALFNSKRRQLDISFESAFLLGQDHGDLPQSYGDAYHEINETLILGSTVADDEETQYSADASADDTNGTDDEDAVSIEGVFGDLTVRAGDTPTFNVMTKGNGYLSAWVDINKDGHFTDDEQIITDVEVNSTDATIKHIENVSIPSTATVGSNFLRVRLSENNGTKATGDGGIGEVEDYVLTIQDSPTPTPTPTPTP